MTLSYAYAVHEAQRGADYTAQNLQAGISNEIGRLLRERVASDGVFDLMAIYRVAWDWQKVHPEHDIYLLEKSGRVSVPAVLMEWHRRDRVSLEPIQKMLTRELSFQEPIYGEDPAETNRMGIFSVAPFKLGSFDGYLYVILRNHRARLANFPILEQEAWIGSALLGAVIAIMLLFLIRAFRTQLIGAYRKALRSVDTLAPELNARPVLGLAGDNPRDFEGALLRLVEGIVHDRAAVRGREEYTKRLISQVAHDFRMPLALITQTCERLLAGKPLDESEDPVVEAERIRRNAESLSHLLSEFNMLAMLNDGERSAMKIPFHLDELIGELCVIYRPLASEKDVLLSARIPPNLYPVVAEMRLIERVCRNLLENAIRHTPRGGRVAISLERQEREVRVEVVDTGPGIVKEELAHIFRPFYQCRSRRSDNGTSGLGLAVVDGILRAHGSEISVESSEGKGTRFSFRLTLADSAPVGQGESGEHCAEPEKDRHSSDAER